MHYWVRVSRFCSGNAFSAKWPAHFQPRNYAYVDPAKFSNDNAAQEVNAISELVNSLSLDNRLIDAIYQAHKDAATDNQNIDWSSVFEILSPKIK